MKYLLSSSYMRKVAGDAKTYELNGKLKQQDDGYVYVDILDSIMQPFVSLIDEDVEKPPSDLGAHITVISAEECPSEEILELGEDIPFVLKGLEKVNPDGWDEMKNVWFLSLDSPRLEEIRKNYGLSAKHKGHNFHITVAVEPK